MAGETAPGSEGVQATPTLTSPAPAAPPNPTTPAPNPVPDASAAGSQAGAAPTSQTPEQIARAALNPPGANQPNTPATPAPAPWTPPTQEQFAEMQRAAAEYQRLQSQLPQLQQYAQLGVEAYRQQQAARQQQLEREQQQAQAKSWFGLPEFNLGLLDFIETDPATGQLRARDGAPPDALAQYRQFSKALQDTQLKFWTNPQAFLAEPVQRMAAQAAQQLIQQHMGGYEDKVAANQLIEQNAGWMFAQTPDGSRRLSPAGQMYGAAVQEAAQLGIKGSQAQHRYATERVQLQLLLAQQQQAQQAAAGEAGKQQFLQSQQPLAGGAAATPPSVPANTPAPVPGQPTMNLRQALMSNLKAAGYTPETFRAA